MKKQNTVVDLLYAAGVLLISAGAGYLAIPAGLISAGAFLLAAAVLIDRNGGDKT